MNSNMQMTRSFNEYEIYAIILIAAVLFMAFFYENIKLGAHKERNIFLFCLTLGIILISSVMLFNARFNFVDDESINMVIKNISNIIKFASAK